MTTDALGGRVADLFERDVHVMTSDLVHDVDVLLPEERDRITGAVPKRQREFTTGRWCARRLLSAWGYPVRPLLPGPDRAPLWPEGIVGSISHSATRCAVAVARRTRWAAVGLDLEDGAALEERLWPVVLGADEIASLGVPGPLSPGARALVLFSAKEALYKCQYPIWRLTLDFRDVTVRLDPAAGRFDARIRGPASTRPLDPLVGRFQCDETGVMTGIAIPAGADRRPETRAHDARTTSSR